MPGIIICGIMPGIIICGIVPGIICGIMPGIIICGIMLPIIGVAVAVLIGLAFSVVCGRRGRLRSDGRVMRQDCPRLKPKSSLPVAFLQFTGRPDNKTGAASVVLDNCPFYYAIPRRRLRAAMRSLPAFAGALAACPGGPSGLEWKATTPSASRRP